MFISVAIKQYKSNDESCEGTNTEDPDVNFERIENQAEDEEDEDSGFPLDLERMVAREDREMKRHQEETKIVNLGIGIGMNPDIVQHQLLLNPDCSPDKIRVWHRWIPVVPQ